uniref:CD164 sialomucin-like 2 n=1 Tax=Nothobranchius kuhntae TaxID=321403 RepID=A0A1A8JBT7_NOTKU
MPQLVLKVLCCSLLLVAMVPFVHSQSDCSQAESCDLCVGVSMLNLTGCVWRLCPSGDDSTKPSQGFSQAKFDMSSFIGGIILVLSLQAGGFFAMRFMKSKEQSSYDPIEQPQ